MDSDWNMNGCGRNDPARLKSPDEVVEYIRETGFLPLFSAGIPAFPWKSTCRPLTGGRTIRSGIRGSGG